ncbi:hypothetical protein FHS29_005239 [Saccharothrix tamanrassetensis]|uniref:Uncharacterized protein n=1 Tax=Saccharothrix tamanrassetensis TaxID=1051531 RepID=A0A841CM28_9PSEU|nr:hypothetical protein [Saccharothrix tamanrassetensis]MBB5958631.1 hypothetical protein [Saccharothrix tamanrassetensis]
MERPQHRRPLVAVAMIGVALAAVAGLAALAVWLLPAESAVPDDHSTERPAPTDKLLDVEIPPSSYDVAASSWQPYGPLYEAANDLYTRHGVTHAHVYGQSTGRLVYRIDLDEFSGTRAELTARLSADAVGYSDAQARHSDVALVVNRTPLPVRRVTPDDGRGAHYTWQFDATLLRPGQNTVEFVVDASAEFPNGLCVYGDAIAPGHTDERIKLRTG